MTEVIELPALTPEQVAKSGKYLTLDEISDKYGMSRQTLNNASARGDLVPDALIETGKRGRPPFLVKASNARKFAKVHGWL